MDRLIIIAYPGDEVVSFGGLITRFPRYNWRVCAVFKSSPVVDEKGIFLRSCKELGIQNCCYFGYPILPHEQVDFGFIVKKLKKMPFLNKYRKVYTYDVRDHDHLRQDLAGAVAESIAKTAQFYSFTISDFPSEVIVLTRKEYEKKIKLVNKYYNYRLLNKSIVLSDIKSIETYKRFQQKDILNYYRGLVRLPVYDPDDPWDLYVPPELNERGFIRTESPYKPESPWDIGRSKYEKFRHLKEIESLKFIRWRTVLEIGACVGDFTELLSKTFPDRNIIAIEPNSYFFYKLERRVATQRNVKLIHGGMEKIKNIHVDVAFISSVLYYIRPFPIETILELNTRYWVVSHLKKYHEKIVDRVFKNLGFTRRYKKELHPIIEPLHGILDIKDGTQIEIWGNNNYES